MGRNLFLEPMKKEDRQTPFPMVYSVVSGAGEAGTKTASARGNRPRSSQGSLTSEYAEAPKAGTLDKVMSGGLLEPE